MNKLKKYRISDIISVVGLLAVIYGFGILHIAMPDRSFSNDENRSLQTVPRLTVETLTNGKLAKDISSYCSDQMPFRDGFVGTKALAEAMLLKKENNGVILGSDGHIIAKQDYTDYVNAEKEIDAVKFFANSIDIPVHIAVAGRSQDVLAYRMPSLYPAQDVSDGTFEKISVLLDGLDSVDLLTPLRTRAEMGEYVYYRTDHHWTTLGAYYAYAEIMRSLGTEPYPLDFFKRETVTDSFFGTTWSKAGMKWIEPDSIEFFRYTDDSAFTTEIGSTIRNGFYDLSYLEAKSKYSAFIGETFSLAKIRAESDSPYASSDRETLLVIKDSFAHSAAPFLALHYDLVMVDLRYYRFSVPELMEAENIDRVLILCNADNLLNTSSLSTLAAWTYG